MAKLQVDGSVCVVEYCLEHIIWRFRQTPYTHLYLLPRSADMYALYYRSCAKLSYYFFCIIVFRYSKIQA
jgi:hypothetical protein